VEVTGSANPLAGRDVGYNPRPAFGDLDGDGDFDLLAGDHQGSFRYFENTGDAGAPSFSAAVSNPFGLDEVNGGPATPALGDLDRDGDLDLVAGGYYGTFVYFENTGSAINPAFALATGDPPLGEEEVAYYSRPAIGDFDRDGDLDVVSGDQIGHLSYFENQGSATVPLFRQLGGAANPLDGVDVGDYSAPAAVDLDGDGDADLVTGRNAGTFAVHYFPEPAWSLLLGAGIALLALLEQLRARIRSARGGARAGDR